MYNENNKYEERENTEGKGKSKKGKAILVTGRGGP
jgi:hypothetical protein